MSSLICVGVDPGPTPGVAVLIYDGEGQRCTWRAVFQCDADNVQWLAGSALHWRGGAVRRILAVEKFVVGGRAGRSSTPKAGAVTRDMVGALEQVAHQELAQYVLRSASEVKPWATDERLVKAGFVLPKGMPHARDAARHCLFAAVHDGGIPDPLSKAAGLKVAQNKA